MASTHVHPEARATSGTIPALVQLTKPSITRMVLITTACGAVMAPGSPALLPLVLGVVGTALVVGSANALNMYLERDVDALMSRTRSRPLPSGRLAPEVALIFGVAIGLIGLVMLTFLVNPLTGLLAAIALLSYVLVYTPLKPVTPFALHVGAVPGAMPPLIGYAAVTGTVAWESLALFAILFVWQLPHFAAITIFRREEYARAGLQVVSVARGDRGARRFVLTYAFVLLAVTLAPMAFGFAGPLYIAIALATGVPFLALSAWGLHPRSQGTVAGHRWARRTFFASMPYLVLVFGALVATAG